MGHGGPPALLPEHLPGLCRPLMHAKAVGVCCPPRSVIHLRHAACRVASRDLILRLSVHLVASQGGVVGQLSH